MNRFEVERMNRSPVPPAPTFTFAEAMIHADRSGFNCGPAALAVICDGTCGGAMRALPEFDAKGFTNLTMMQAGIRAFGRSFATLGPFHDPRRQPNWPDYGIVRIQWGGKWCRHGVPMQARYHHTHWVASCVDRNGKGPMIFDINAMDEENEAGWVPLRYWAGTFPKVLSEGVRGSDGSWWKTHAIEVERR